MSVLKDLIQQVNDPVLRKRLTEEADKVTKTQKFGLVFEEHLPEYTPLYDIPVRVGSLVALKTGYIRDVYTVLEISGNTARCERRETHEEKTFNLDEIVVIAQFGEPIYPYLKPVDTVCNAPESGLWHTLIEADNYHALQLLEYLYAGKVDCIYIDPPYNTGARDWKYNNNYVDNSDVYRHSKWLSMMEKRLKIAKKLLNPKDSVLIVTIDEKEYLHLGCLLEKEFPEAVITMITDVINPRAGVARKNSFTRTQEYIFTVQMGSSRVVPEKQDGVNKNPIWFSLMRTGSDSARTDSPNLFYPVWVYPNGKLYSIGDNIDLNTNKDTIKPPKDGLIGIWPIRPDGRENRWQLARKTLETAFAEGTARLSVRSQKITINYLRTAEKNRIKSGELIVTGKDSDGALIIERNANVAKTKVPTTVWNKSSHDAGIYGSTLLSTIFCDKRFTYPKSLYSEYDIIRCFVENKPKALIVDFFAGSGTTLHAINLLNAEDGGTRQCILVTNNEVSEGEVKTLTGQGYKPGDDEWEKYGIARFVTWPRTVCTIEGHDVNGQPLTGNYIGSDMPMADGFKANAAFFSLGFLDKTAVALGMRFKKILPLLWMKAGAVGQCPDIEGDIPNMLVLPENKFAVLSNENAFKDFEKELERHPEIETVFIVTDYEVNYRSMVRNLNVKNTYQLYRDYLDNFRINHGRD